MKKIEINIMNAKIKIKQGPKLSFDFFECESDDFKIEEGKGSIKVTQLKLRKRTQIWKSNFININTYPQINITIDRYIEELIVGIENGVIDMKNIETKNLKIFMDNGSIEIRKNSSENMEVFCKNGIVKLVGITDIKSINVEVLNGSLSVKRPIKEPDMPTVICRSGVSRIFGKVKLGCFIMKGDDSKKFICKNGTLNIN